MACIIYSAIISSKGIKIFPHMSSLSSGDSCALSMSTFTPPIMHGPPTPPQTNERERERGVKWKQSKGKQF